MREADEAGPESSYLMNLDDWRSVERVGTGRCEALAGRRVAAIACLTAGLGWLALLDAAAAALDRCGLAASGLAGRLGSCERSCASSMVGFQAKSSLLASAGMPVVVPAEPKIAASSGSSVLTLGTGATLLTGRAWLELALVGAHAWLSGRGAGLGTGGCIAG